MIRIIAALIGVGFSGWLLVSFAIGLGAFVSEPPAETVEHAFHKHPEPLKLASDGPLGRFDRQQLQRGFQVYKEVCSACHSLHQVAFRSLTDLGYNEAEVKAIAEQWPIQQPTFDEKTGETGERPNLAADKFPRVYYAGQGVPPDLSLITKARHGGAAYVHSLLTGYTDQAGYKNEEGEVLLEKFPDAATPAGLYFNPYFANLNIAMPPPFVGDGQVTYADGTEATVDQMSTDVSAFLVWTAEPKLEKRNQTGWAVLGFLLFATVLAFLAYRNVWADKKH